MRPLLRPGLTPADTRSIAATDLLMHAFGTYCAFSEEPLFDTVGVWSRAGHDDVDPSMPPGEMWDDVLLVSPTTLAAARRPGIRQTVAMLTPDVDRTFLLEDSPLIYALASITLILLDEDGEAQDKGELRELAIVTAATPAAQSTIDMFALNGRYFSPSDATMRMPASAYLSREDNRPFLRTEVWRRAEAVADQIAGVGAAMRPILLEQVRMLAAASGFWSVWATVLWNRFGDRTMLLEVLARPDAAPAIRGGPIMDRALADVPGGVHQAFPGTRTDWLD